jgi:hypothetical protein
MFTRNRNTASEETLREELPEIVDRQPEEVNDYIRPDKTILERLEDCWVRLITLAPMLYGHRNGLRLGRIGPAVTELNNQMQAVKKDQTVNPQGRLQPHAQGPVYGSFRHLVGRLVADPRHRLHGDPAPCGVRGGARDGVVPVGERPDDARPDRRLRVHVHDEFRVQPVAATRRGARRCPCTCAGGCARAASSRMVRSPAGCARIAWDYAAHRRGPLAAAPSQLAAFVRSWEHGGR